MAFALQDFLDVLFSANMIFSNHIILSYTSSVSSLHMDQLWGGNK